MLNMQKEKAMSTAYNVPESAAAEEEEVLPEFDNGITPRPPAPPPVITEPVPMLPVDLSLTPLDNNQYKAPAEAVPGVGGILGVQAEES